MALTFPREPAVEAYLDGWTDVTSQLKQNVALVVTRGGADEQPVATPGTFSCSVRNETGNWTVDNPAGAYYGLLGRNTPIRYLLAHLEHGFDQTLSNTWGSLWTLDGTAANFDAAAGVGTILVPNSASPQAAYLADYSDWSAYEISVDVLLPFPTSGGALGCTSGVLLRGSTASSGWRVALSASEVGGMYLGIVDSAGSFLVGHPRFVETVATPTWFTVKVVVEGGLILAKTWNRSESEPLEWWVTHLADDLPTEGWVGVRAATSAGSTNTLVSYDNFTVRIPRFHGEITSISPKWDESHRAKWADLKCSGIFLRMSQGKTPARTAPEQYMLGLSTPPAGYWPFDDGELTTSGRVFGNGRPSGLALLGSAGYVRGQFGKGELAPWLRDGARVGTSQAAFATLQNALSGATGYTAHAMVRLPDQYADAASADVWTFYTLGTSGTWAVFLVSLSGEVQISRPITGAIEATFSAPSLFDGLAHHIGFRTIQVGADVAWTFYVDGVTAGSGTILALTNPSVGTMTFQLASVATDETRKRSFGHYAIFSGSSDTPSDIADAMAGHPGETAGRRAERLADENDIPFAAAGDLDDTAAMGPQGNHPLLELFQQCADADLAILLEGRGFAGIMFVCRNALYNQSAAITLDYSAKQIQHDLRIDPDDRYTRNDVTAKRLDGSEYRVEQTTGSLNVNNPGSDADAVGRYDTSLTVAVQTDDQLPSIASWMLHLGTNPESRCPSVEVEFRSGGLTDALQAALLVADVGNKLTVENLEEIFRYDPLNQIVRGYTEVLDRKRSHRLTINCTPASPYDVFELETAGYDRLDTEGCVLSVAVDDNDTTLHPATTSGPLWTTAAGDYPMTSYIGGERITVTDCNTIAVGTPLTTAATVGNNASVLPTLHATAAHGNLLLLVAAIRNSGTGTPVTPTGWRLLVTAGNVGVYAAIYAAVADTATYRVTGVPTVTFTGGVANATTMAKVIVLPGTWYDVDNVMVSSTDSLNVSAQDIALPGITVPEDNCAVISIGWKQDDWTSVATLSGMTELAEDSSTTGDDMALVVDYVIQTTRATLQSTSFVVTGGATAISRGLVLAVRSDVQEWIATRAANGVQKSHAAGAAITLPALALAL